MNKEQIYDEQISPLMGNIIAICQEHGIPMLASFHIPNGENDDLLCTTALPDENNTMRPDLRNALSIIQGRHPVIAITIS